MYLKDALSWYGFRLPNYHPDADLGVLTGMPGEKEDNVENTDEDKIEDDKGDKEDDKEEKDEDKDDKGEDEVDEDKEDEDEDEDEDKKEDKTEDEDEVEDEDEDEDEIRTSSWTDIKKKYPDFGKEFPDVKNALFREQEFSNIFSGPTEAKEAIGRLETFDQLTNDVMVEGNIIDLVEHVKKGNKESYEKIVFSLLPHIQENDKDLYYELVARPIKQLLRAAWANGNGEKTDLGKAAAHIHKFFFKNVNFDEKVKSEEEFNKSTKSKREVELEERLTSIEQGKLKEFMTSVDTSYVTKMNKAIRESLDKDERLNEYTKSKLVDDILRSVKNRLNKDTTHVNTLNSLLKKAKTAGFTNDFKTRIINSALVRAKALVPEERKKAVSLALGKKVNDNKERKPEKKVERERKRESPNNNKKEVKELSDLDVLRA